MKQLKILIADDESEARALLLYLLRAFPQPFEIEESIDGNETIHALERFKPDILFLDVNMPEKNGLEIINTIRGKLSPAIIFTTAFDAYALSAFEYDAVDYLLKPFGPERFNRALQKAIRHIELLIPKIEDAFASNIRVKKGIKTLIIGLSEVLYFQASGQYIEVLTHNNCFLISTPLHELESNLNPRDFIRIHKSRIINVNVIKEITSLMNGDYTILLANGKDVRASRHYKDNLKKILLK